MQHEHDDHDYCSNTVSGAARESFYDVYCVHGRIATPQAHTRAEQVDVTTSVPPRLSPPTSPLAVTTTTSSCQPRFTARLSLHNARSPGGEVRTMPRRFSVRRVRQGVDVDSECGNGSSY